MDDWLVRQHAALARVATLVARQPPAEDVFAVVTREAGMLLGARMTALLRVESADEAMIVAGWSSDGTAVPVGSRAALDGRGLVGRIMRTGQRVRLEDFEEVGGAVAAEMRGLGVPAAVAGPIVIAGRIWGALSAAWPQGRRMPAGAEDRIAAFAVATLERAEGRSDIAPEARRLLMEALAETRSAAGALRAIADGLHPAVLTERGLAAAVAALTDSVPLAADVDIPGERYPAVAESLAYAVAAEGLAGLPRDSRASTARIRASHTEEALVLTLEADGAGGATVSPGLRERVAALGATLILDSPPGEGTRISARIPLGPAPPAPAARPAPVRTS